LALRSWSRASSTHRSLHLPSPLPSFLVVALVALSSSWFHVHHRRGNPHVSLAVLGYLIALAASAVAGGLCLALLFLSVLRRSNISSKRTRVPRAA
jgi:hypothetical protein